MLAQTPVQIAWMTRHLDAAGHFIPDEIEAFFEYVEQEQK
jgi:hypothetical protein